MKEMKTRDKTMLTSTIASTFIFGALLSLNSQANNSYKISDAQLNITETSENELALENWMTEGVFQIIAPEQEIVLKEWMIKPDAFGLLVSKGDKKNFSDSTASEKLSNLNKELTEEEIPLKEWMFDSNLLLNQDSLKITDKKTVKKGLLDS